MGVECPLVLSWWRLEELSLLCTKNCLGIREASWWPPFVFTCTYVLRCGHGNHRLSTFLFRENIRVIVLTVLHAKLNDGSIVPLNRRGRLRLKRMFAACWVSKRHLWKVTMALVETGRSSLPEPFLGEPYGIEGTQNLLSDPTLSPPCMITP